MFRALHFVRAIVGGVYLYKGWRSYAIDEKVVIWTYE